MEETKNETWTFSELKITQNIISTRVEMSQDLVYFNSQQFLPIPNKVAVS